MGQVAVGGPLEGGNEVTARLRALQSATDQLLQLRVVEGAAPVVAAAVRDGLGAEVLVMAIRDEDGRHLRTDRQPPSVIPADGPSLLAEVARSGRPLYLHSFVDGGHGPTRQAMTKLRPGTESVAALPLPGPEVPLGVVVIGRPDRRGFSADDIAFLSVLSSMCAMAIESVRRSADRSFVAGIVRDVKRRVGRMRIDLERLHVEVDGRSASLTPTELRLLTFLAEEPGRPRTRSEILRHLWHTDHVGGERACDAHIWNLRRKIERDPSRPEVVVTRRGVGYALEVG